MWDHPFVGMTPMLYVDGEEVTNVNIPEGIEKLTGTFAWASSIESVTIPSSVTSIGDSTFAVTGLKNVTIPGSVTSIGSQAFYSCQKLTRVTISEGVKSIGISAFSNCTGLTSVTIPESVTKIGSGAFYKCENLHKIFYSGTKEQWAKIEKYGNEISAEVITDCEVSGNLIFKVINGEVIIYGCVGNADGELTIPDTLGGYPVTTIDDYAFSGCSSLTKITIPEGVKSLGEYAFSGCTGLTGITLPDSVTSIEKGVLDGCSSLTKLTIPKGVKSIDYAFSGCTGLTEITIPESVTSIESGVFSDCTSLARVNAASIEAWCKIKFKTVWANPLFYAHKLYIDGKEVTSVTIPESITSIGDLAFAGCTDLTEVTIPEGVTSIGGGTFYGCTGLTEITIADSVVSIGRYAFENCSSLTEITVPKGMTEIGEEAFYGLTGLAKITIPEGVTTIGRDAFKGCSSLRTVTVPKSVVEISEAFSGCDSLEEITLPFVGTSRTSTRYRGTLGAIYRTNTSLRKVTITDATQLSDKAFSGCSTLTEINLNNGITSIGENAFSGCTGLTEIVIPEGVKSIENFAFYDCTGLTSIVIPEGVKNIGSLVFSGCTGLTSVTIPDSVTSIGEDIFDECSNLTEVSMPSGTLIIEGIRTLDAAKATLKKITLTSGTRIDSKALSGFTALEEVILPDELTEIGSNAFANCEKLSKINIPGSVRTIGDGAFADCGRLRTVTLADGLETVGKNAFKNCGMVRKLTIPGSVAEIGDGAFYGCNSLEEISVPFVGITESSTGADAVFGAIFGRTQTGETEVTLQYPGYYYYIPNTLKKVTVTSAETLPEFAFRNCRRFTEINLTDGLLKIDSSAFESCDALLEITIPGSVTDIADYAFYDCGGLKTVTLGTGIKTIGTDAFSGCKAIETAVYPGSADEWAAVIVEDGNEDLTSKLARTYTYTFKNADGSVFDTGVIPYGTAIPLPEGEPEKANDEKFTYAFAGWAGYSEGMTIEGDIAFEPEFEGTLNRYTYRFISNGEVVKEATADYGTVIEAPETAPEGEFPLIFSEWEGFTEGMELTGSIDFNAVFINRSFTVTPEGGETVTVVYGDEFVLGFSNKPGQHFVGYFTGKDGEGDKITGSDGASLEPFTFDGDITVYPYYVEDLLEKIALLGDEAVRAGEDAVYKVRFATAREVSELYLEIRYPESLEFKATNILDAVSADLISSESADGFVTAVFKCVLSEEKTAFEAPVTPFEIVFGVGDGAEDFTIEILASSRMKGDEDFAFSEVFTAETKVNNVIPGDVTGDGVVNKMDALRLKKYLADLDVEIDLAAADVNCDGVVNKMDALRLKKYLAGQDVKLGE